LRRTVGLRGHALLALVLCGSLAHGSAHAGCDRFVAALAQAAAAHERLVALPIDGEPDPSLTLAAQQALDRNKAAIAQLVDARMGCTPGDVDARALERDFASQMQALNAQCDERCSQSAYHDPPQFEVARVARHPNLIAIQARQSIQCGADGALFVYEYAERAWHERIRWQSASYDKVSGALEAFDYRVAPPDAHGDWYVLVKDIMPWCSSTWSTLRYAVLRPATAQSAQRVLFHGADSIWWGSDDIGRIAAQAGQFDVRFHAASIDGGIHNREWIRHYAIDGDHVTRTAPVALSARDFVDEWLVTPWPQAREWSLPKQQATLEAWHTRLGDRQAHGYEFAAARACNDRPRHVEVELSDIRDEATYFLSVDGGSADFRLSAVAERASAQCGGKDLLNTMQTK